MVKSSLIEKPSSVTSGISVRSLPKIWSRRKELLITGTTFLMFFVVTMSSNTEEISSGSILEYLHFDQLMKGSSQPESYIEHLERLSGPDLLHVARYSDALSHHD